MNRRSILAAYKKKSSHFQTGVTGFKSGNLFTKAQNRFCPMCTKECHTVLTRSKPFWGQFWGQIRETDSRTLQSNKCAVLVSLRNAGTYITGFTQVQSPTNQYISFTLRQEVVRKPTLHHPRTPPLSPRETPLFGRVRAASVPMPAQPYTAPNSPSLRFFCPRTAFPVQALPGRVSPVQEKSAQINTK